MAVMQADGGQLSGTLRRLWWRHSIHIAYRSQRCEFLMVLFLCVEWTPMYNPTAEQAEVDRKVAYEAGVPHGAA